MIFATQAPCPLCGHPGSRTTRPPHPDEGCDNCRRSPEATHETVPSGAHVRPVSNEILPPGFIIGGCRIEALLGRGGMGAVYRAVQLARGRAVAIKVLPAAFALDHEHRTRFEREARILESLDHPRVVKVFDRGEEAGRGYLVMEEVSGGSLRDRLRAGPLEACDALEIGRQVLEALEAAHAAGLVHRDVKPGNVLLDRAGNVRLADFGVARVPERLAAGDPDLSLPGLPIGTFAYMAPEQRVPGREVDARTDLHAVGILLFEMLTGERPRGAELPGARRPGLDLRLDALVARALAEEPSERHASATAMLRDLEPLRQVTAKGRRLLDHADLALATGEIETARRLVDQAATLIPDDPRVEEAEKSVTESTDPLVAELDELASRLEKGDLLGVRDAVGVLAAEHPAHAGVTALLTRVESSLRRVGLLASRAAAALRAGRDEEAWLAAGATFDYLPPSFAREADDVSWPDPYRILSDVELLRRARSELEAALARGDRTAARTARNRIRGIAPHDAAVDSRGSFQDGTRPGRVLRVAAAWFVVLALALVALHFGLNRPAGASASPAAAPEARDIPAGRPEAEEIVPTVSEGAEAPGADPIAAPAETR